MFLRWPGDFIHASKTAWVSRCPEATFSAAGPRIPAWRCRATKPLPQPTLGPIFPPSLPFVIYGMMANASIGALFMAGILPGVVMAGLMMLTVYIFARRYGWGSDTPFDPVDRTLATSLGLTDQSLARLMAEVGFRENSGNWAWRGTHARSRSRPQPARPGNAFAALAGLKR